MKSWKLKRIVQCAKCPWKTSTDPHDIPNGYCEARHANLKSTIAEDGDLSSVFSRRMHIMACHEDHEAHCVGWLINQLNQGNNIALRIQVLSCENIREAKIVGPQHERFEDTLP